MRPPRQLLQETVKRTAGALDVVRRPADGVVVLIYHRVGGGSGSDVDLPVEQFDEQMADARRQRPSAFARRCARAPSTSPGTRWLRSWSPSTTARPTSSSTPCPCWPVTGIPVTLYLATWFTESGATFPPDGRRCRGPAWPRPARPVSSTSDPTPTATCCSTACPDAEVDDELDRSIDLIGDRLGRPPLDFAYPKALPGSPAADRAVRARFRSAAVAGCKPNVPGATDPFALARSPIQVSDGMRWFERKVAGGMAFEDDLRRLLNRVRYQRAVT